MRYPRSVGNTDTGTTNYGGITITGDSTANTKGAWTELLPATAFDTYFLTAFWIGVFTSGSDSPCLLDIGADPAGGTSYGVVVPNVLADGVKGGSPRTGQQQFAIPCFIPAGSTIAARLQSAITSQALDIVIRIYGGINSDDPFPGHGLIVDYGPNTSTSHGIPPADSTTHVKSAWVEITSATTHPHRGLSVAIQPADSALGNLRGIFDVGIGAAASEVVIVSDCFIDWRSDATVFIVHPNLLSFQIDIPEGSRLAVRAQANSSATSDIDYALYGWG